MVKLMLNEFHSLPESRSIYIYPSPTPRPGGAKVFDVPMADMVPS